MHNSSGPELILGIKNFAGLEACSRYADAVYFSTDRLSLRAKAKEITLETLKDFVYEVKARELKAYLAVNSAVNEARLDEVEEVVDTAVKAGVDAVIAWDPAVILKARKAGLRVHISTQANVTNHETAEFYRTLGAERIVLSRELSLEEIRKIRQQTEIKVETFVHGAMCMAVSGRCHLSAYVLGKSGNCGECTQPCRWEWELHGENGLVTESRGKYLLSAKDLCMIEHVPELIEAGIDSFKVEGRLRDPGYLEVVSRCYREAIDACKAGSYTREKADAWRSELSSVYNRGFSTGFYFGVPGLESFSPEKGMNASEKKRRAAGVVENYYPKQQAAAIRLLEEGLAIGDEILIEGSTTYLKQQVRSLIKKGMLLQTAEKGDEVGLAVDKAVRKNDRIFII
ncbi:peptidase U32 [Methanosarcina sp. 2.H.T.1A.6]|uniref:peptidase U32 family protein n=1 Tax=unclassified Methanosarcina TaxID=2644672 RepID=UPI000621FD14|nr:MULTISPECIES: peptidase U32 family protein [unclassified Methanosarcina]KKG18199.1 peptidase U32 [Methanosarcina sp. 2.H.T.1A.3]KKG19424.1 peptidase U32 [Methanosarcina sp. 2.H.T.1A.6]KKG25535.1 peptidase U32 [Methanosarcina sp. 2.H.T.1A.8]KKG26578.1 peptidase U32 [Methanosarcina sp. 2.H.T.1A.15]